MNSGFDIFLSQAPRRIGDHADADEQDDIDHQPQDTGVDVERGRRLDQLEIVVHRDPADQTRHDTG